MINQTTPTCASCSGTCSFGRASSMTTSLTGVFKGALKMSLLLALVPKLLLAAEGRSSKRRNRNQGPTECKQCLHSDQRNFPYGDAGFDHLPGLRLLLMLNVGAGEMHRKFGKRLFYFFIGSLCAARHEEGPAIGERRVGEYRFRSVFEGVSVPRVGPSRWVYIWSGGRSGG